MSEAFEVGFQATLGAAGALVVIAGAVCALWVIGFIALESVRAFRRREPRLPPGVLSTEKAKTVRQVEAEQAAKFTERARDALHGGFRDA